MKSEIIQAARGTTIAGNLSAMKNCVSRIRRKTSPSAQEIHDYLNLIDDAITVIRTQMTATPTETHIETPSKKWKISKFLEDTDKFFMRHTKIYYSILVAIFVSYMLMLVIVAIEG